MSSNFEYATVTDTRLDEQVLEGSGLHDDACYLDCTDTTKRKPLKYMTRNFHDRGCNPRELCFPGFLPKDGEGWAQCDIDNDSGLRHSKLTNAGFPQQFGGLPKPTVPFQGNGCIDTDTEMDLRGLDTFADKSCLPRDVAFHNRRFDYLDHLCYNPVAVKNVVWNGYQTGMDTRQQRIEDYSSGPSGYAVQRYEQPESRNPLATYDSSKYQGNYGNGGFIPGFRGTK
jgi:hypothetical protein